MHGFAEVFIALFVAVSPLTLLPLFLSLVGDADQQAQRRLARAGIITALSVAIGVTLIGQALFSLMGISVDDLRVGGGLILLILSIHDLLFSQVKRKSRDAVSDDVAVVPLGTPLIVGPATMTACLVLADTHGRAPVLLSVSIIMVIVGAVLFNAHRLAQLVNPAVVRAFGKVMALFLSAIAVSMIRTGVAHFIATTPG